MVQFFETKDQLRQLFAKLIKDQVKEVKVKCVVCFLEVCKVFMTVDLCKHLREVFDSLLHDEDPEVLTKFAPLLAELTAIFQEIKSSEPESPTKELKESKEKEGKDSSIIQSSEIKSYLDAVLSVGTALTKLHNWRLEVKFLDGFAIYYDIFDIKELNEKLVPYLIKRINEGINEVRLKSIEMLVKFMRINYISAKFKEHIKYFQDELGYSSCYQMRIAYINLFLEFAEVYSRTFIKQNLLSQIFFLKVDKTVQVRRKLASHLADIRGVLLPDDAENIKKFAEFVKRLAQDSDREVSNKAKNFQEVLQEPIPNCEEDEKAKFEEEEELRNREVREQEEFKKRNTRDYLSSRLEYIQNYGNFPLGSDNRRLSYKAVKTNPAKIFENSKPKARHSLIVSPTIKIKSTLSNITVTKLSGKSNADSSPLPSGLKTGFSGKASIESSPHVSGKGSK